MAGEGIYLDTLTRTQLQILKYQMRRVSAPYYTGDQSVVMAENIYNAFVKGEIAWERKFELTQLLVGHDFKQSASLVQGDAYAQLCAFGEIEGEKATSDYVSRRIVSALCCYTVKVPDSVCNNDLNIHKADIDTLSFSITGDSWLYYGCYAAVFASDDETPPSFGELIQKMNTPGAEKMGTNCWAGWVGGTETPTEPGAIRYLRTNVICNVSSQGDNTSLWHGITESLVFKIHDWALNDYDDETGYYKIKKYYHIMLFLNEKQYMTTRRNWIEGSTMLNLSSIVMSFTDSVQVPQYVYDLCGIFQGNVDSGNAKAIDLQGGVFSLVNTFKMTDSQAAPLMKNKAEACVFSAIETALTHIKTPNAVYGFRNYPPVTSSGFDFYTVGVDGDEYIRIGCVDENAMLSTNTPLPSVYSLLIGYPVNPGVLTTVYERIIFTGGAAFFSGCMNLKVVIYKGIHNENTAISGGSYGYSTNIDPTKFDAFSFFNGDAQYLNLSTGELVYLTPIYFGYHSSIYSGQEFVFSEYATFSQPGVLIIGVSPVDFSKAGTMKDGEWGQYSPPEYHSQYMQLVDWPLSQTVRVTAIE